MVAPDHDYCVVSETGVRATADLVDANKALHQRIRELQLQVEGLQLRQRFGINRVMGSDDDVRFYTRFASRKYFMAFWALVENAVNNKMVRITSAKTASESSAISHSTVCNMMHRKMIVEYTQQPIPSSTQHNTHPTTPS